MITLKLKIKNELDIYEFQRQFNTVIRFAYNRFRDGLKSSEITKIVKESMRNIELLDFSWIHNAVRRAEFILSKQKDKGSGVVFGGKFNFRRFSKRLISKEEYLKTKNMPIVSYGSASDPCGNRKFRLDVIANNKVIFKFNRHIHIDIHLSKMSKNQ